MGALQDRGWCLICPVDYGNCTAQWQRNEKTGVCYELVASLTAVQSSHPPSLWAALAHLCFFSIFHRAAPLPGWAGTALFMPILHCHCHQMLLPTFAYNGTTTTSPGLVPEDGGCLLGQHQSRHTDLALEHYDMAITFPMSREKEQ